MKDPQWAGIAQCDQSQLSACEVQGGLTCQPLLGLNRKQKTAALLNEIVERTRAEFLKPPLFPVKFLSGSHFTRKDERCPA